MTVHILVSWHADAPRLGISEEVSWREVYMADNNNSLQAGLCGWGTTAESKQITVVHADRRGYTNLRAFAEVASVFQAASCAQAFTWGMNHVVAGRPARVARNSELRYTIAATSD